MSTSTIIVAIILVIVIIFAIYGSYKTLHNERCCSDDKNCCCAETKHCSIRKEKDD